MDSATAPVGLGSLIALFKLYVLTGPLPAAAEAACALLLPLVVLYVSKGVPPRLGGGLMKSAMLMLTRLALLLLMLVVLRELDMLERVVSAVETECASLLLLLWR